MLGAGEIGVTWLSLSQRRSFDLLLSKLTKPKNRLTNLSGFETLSGMSNALREWRLKREMTVEAAADFLGFSKGTVSKWENGALPVHEHIVTIAEKTNNEVPILSWYESLAEGAGQ